MIDHLSPLGYWRPIKGTSGRLGRSVMAQVLIALHHLNRSSRSERGRINLNISQGSTHNDTWKLIDLLVNVANRYIWLSPVGQRCVGATTPFDGCIGFLDGTDIPLKERPRHTWERRKDIYGFNLTAIDDWKSGLYMRTWVTLHHLRIIQPTNTVVSMS
jgi:hypothetical protein